MDKSALELMPAQLQGVVLGEPDISRAVALAKPTNDKIRKAADARLQFEDEPASYIGLLRAEGQEDEPS
jgi:hypothetical protein